MDSSCIDIHNNPSQANNMNAIEWDTWNGSMTPLPLIHLSSKETSAGFSSCVQSEAEVAKGEEKGGGEEEKD